MQIFGGYVEKKCRFSEVYGRGKDEPQALRLYVAATKRTPNVEPQCLRLKPILINSNYTAEVYVFNIVICSLYQQGFMVSISSFVHYISRGLCFQY
ncbi:MAG: hypothetical protein IKO99_04370, partial [Bacteroidales bacterium]|nr:hypothetical protein [Bacteroidales bacterium]